MPSIDAVDRSIELEIALEIRDSARRCVFSCVWVNSETDTRDRAKKQIESSKKHIESSWVWDDTRVWVGVRGLRASRDASRDESAAREATRTRTT